MSILPKTARKQCDEWEQLHPAEKHEEHEQPFGDLWEEDIRASRSHLTQTRTDIAQCGYRSTKGGLDVDAQGQQKDWTNEEDQEIDKYESDVLVDTAGGDGFSVDFHR